MNHPHHGPRGPWQGRFAVVVFVGLAIVQAAVVVSAVCDTWSPPASHSGGHP